MVEKDIFSQDIHATLKGYAEISASKKGIIANEVMFVRLEEIDIIVGDIPPLASEIGDAASIPTLAMGNFSWDFIYELYISQYPQFSYLIDEIRASYGKTDLLLRLPLHHEMEAFPTQRDIPLVMRKREADPDQIRWRLGIDGSNSKSVVLIALRMNDGVPTHAIQDLVESNEFIAISTFPLPFNAKDNVHVLGPEWRSSEFPDIVGISDLVISKLGYGIVSECIAAQTPLIYIPRADFAEYEVLKNDSCDMLHSHLMPKSDFLDGKWYDHAKVCLSRSFDWQEVRTDGAEAAAEVIISRVRT